MALDDHFDPSNLGRSLVRTPPLPVAGFWMRLVAFLVDGIVLSSAFYILARGARDWLLALGPWATVLAGFLMFAYFWLGDGPVGKGRTVGKLLMNLRTVHAGDGSVNGAGPAAIRALLLITSTPVLFSNFWFVALISPVFNPAPDTPLQFFLFRSLPGNLTLAVLCGQVVHMAFNPTRQALHDTAAGTLVLGADHAGTTWERLVELAGAFGMERARRARRAGWLCLAIVLMFLGYVGNQTIQERRRLGRFEDQARVGRMLDEFQVQLLGGERRPAVKEADPEAVEARRAERTRRNDARGRVAADDAATTATPPKEFVFYLLRRGADRRPEPEIRRDVNELADRLMIFFREQQDKEIARAREAEAGGEDGNLPAPVALPDGSHFKFIYQEYLDLVLYQKGYDVLEVGRVHRLGGATSDGRLNRD